MLPIIDRVNQGYNATCFAYGSTGAGKTYTMFGNSYFSHCNEPGLVEKTIHHCLAQSDDSFAIKMSYLELYNEQVKDLLGDSGRNINIVEDAVKGVIVPDLSQYTLKTYTDFNSLVNLGNAKRTMASTGANQFSSRSHAILQLYITKTQLDKVQYSKLSLIDLAGSERAQNTQNKGQRMIEGANINKSLLALGNCIMILSDKRKRQFIPYRDSKLTRLLKDSLGGNTVTAMIACISPAPGSIEESLHTLNYAARARNIRSKVSRTVREVGKDVIQGLQSQIQQLQKKVQVSRSLKTLLQKNMDEENSIKQEIQYIDQENCKRKALIKEILQSIEDQNEIEDKKAQLTQLNRDITLQENKRSSLQQKLYCIMKEKTKLKQNQDKKDKEISQLENTTQALVQEKESLFELNTIYQQRIQQVQKESEQKDQLIKSMQLELERIRKQFDDQRQEITDFSDLERSMSPVSNKSVGSDPDDTLKSIILQTQQFQSKQQEYAQTRYLFKLSKPQTYRPLTTQAFLTNFQQTSQQENQPAQPANTDKVSFQSLKKSLALRKGHFSYVYQSSLQRAQSVERLNAQPMRPTQQIQRRLINKQNSRTPYNH